MTFSIIGYDPDAQMIGSAVASKWTGVGSCVQFFQPHVGLVNMQNHSYAQIAFRVLKNMETGETLETSLENALLLDTAGQKRQFILADLEGNFLTYSGDGCNGIYHEETGRNCAAAGNTIAGKDVITAMVTAFEQSRGENLTERLVLALEAGQAAGGDTRGQEAAAIRVFQTSYPQQRFYPVDLRVDSHDEPLIELRRLLDVFAAHERRFEI